MSSNIHSASQEEILEQAIQKATDNGFKPWFSWPYSGQIDEEGLGYDSEYGYIIEVAVSDIIFNHDFAKALWGDDSIEWGVGTPRSYVSGGRSDIPKDIIPRWKAMLQQMVIADDPIKYLGENI